MLEWIIIILSNQLELTLNNFAIIYFFSEYFFNFGRMDSKSVDFFWNKESVIEILIWLAVFLLLTVSSFSLDFCLSVSLSVVLVFGMIILSLLNRKLIIPLFLQKERFTLSFVFSLVALVLMTIIISYLEDKVLYYFI